MSALLPRRIAISLLALFAIAVVLVLVERRVKPQLYPGVMSPPYAFTFGPNNQLVMSTQNSRVQTWVAERKHWRSFPFNPNYGGQMPLIYMRPSADRKKLFTAQLASSGITPIYCWDIATRKELWHASPPMGFIKAMDISPDGQRAMISNGADAFLIDLNQAWKLQPKSQDPKARIYPTHLWKAPQSVVALSFSPTAPILATVMGDGKVLFRDVAQNRELGSSTPLNQYGFPGYAGNTYGAPPVMLEWSPDGNVLAAALMVSSNAVQVFLLDKNGHSIGQYQVSEPPASNSSSFTPFASPLSLSFAKDGKTLAVGAQKVHIVSVPAAQEVRTFPLPGPAAFSPDGKYLVMGNNDAPKYSVVLWPQ